MLGRLFSLFRTPQPAGPPKLLKSFTPAEQTIARQGVTAAQGQWAIEAAETVTVCLYEVPNPGVEQCVVNYRAELRTEDVKGRAFLEMWCRLPGRGEFFSKGFTNAVKGTCEWASYEIPFYLKAGQKPDLIRLNLVIEGGGKVWLRRLELLTTPLLP
jgi:hypothetical protein